MLRLFCGLIRCLLGFGEKQYPRSDVVLRITQVKGGMPPGNFATVEIKALNKFQSTGQTRDLAFRDKRQ